ncbi:MAG TPA: hypothetical protein VLC09_13360 [Polyangiaceae bacterium]|nr:hypothetical protein [Polyangiaceae bacterium]
MALRSNVSGSSFVRTRVNSTVPAATRRAASGAGAADGDVLGADVVAASGTGATASGSVRAAAQATSPPPKTIGNAVDATGNALKAIGTTAKAARDAIEVAWPLGADRRRSTDRLGSANLRVMLRR